MGYLHLPDLGGNRVSGIVSADRCLVASFMERKNSSKIRADDEFDDHARPHGMPSAPMMFRPTPHYPAGYANHEAASTGQ
jgi:hypothetical protein